MGRKFLPVEERKEVMIQARVTRPFKKTVLKTLKKEGLGSQSDYIVSLIINDLKSRGVI